MKVKLLIVFLLLVCAGSVNGCGKSKNELQSDAVCTKREPDKESMESESLVLPKIDSENTAEKEFQDDIFYWGTEEYFYLLEGEWVAAEYAGEIRDYSFDEAWEEGYEEEIQKYTDAAIEKYLGSEYRVEMDNLLYFGPYADLSIILEDNDRLFDITRFIPGEFITMTPPYIVLSAYLADKEEWYQFIIDADGTALIEIEYHFFRLERKDREKGQGFISKSSRKMESRGYSAKEELEALGIPENQWITNTEERYPLKRMDTHKTLRHLSFYGTISERNRWYTKKKGVTVL